MLTAVMFIAAAFIAAYIIVSFMSAIRMQFVHGVYAHIEYNTAKWSKFGAWAPKRVALLLRLRRLAILAIVVISASTMIPLFVGDSSQSNADASTK
ncbi:hypothetical protein LJR034_004716 [Caballeronia sp. LjRoot34]|uniref:hypothetical protein n=1 Tax=Caballeronia sp. LjRoot34 TaxID=3342325 RepID=UPI003ECC4487